MAKAVKDIKHINVEVQKFEEKLAQFQSYLDLNDITQYGDLRIDEKDFNDDFQDRLHKEITIQTKMQDAILAWLPLLKRLREDEAEKKEQVRGGAEIGGMFQKDK